MNYAYRWFNADWSHSCAMQDIASLSEPSENAREPQQKSMTTSLAWRNILYGGSHAEMWYLQIWCIKCLQTNGSRFHK